jgi:hypothetical protein
VPVVFWAGSGGGVGTVIIFGAKGDLLRRIITFVTSLLGDLHEQLGPFYSDIGHPANVAARHCCGREKSISSMLQDVFPHLMGADIGGIDIAHRVSRNTGRRSTRPDST